MMRLALLRGSSPLLLPPEPPPSPPRDDSFTHKNAAPPMMARKKKVEKICAGQPMGHSRGEPVDTAQPTGMRRMPQEEQTESPKKGAMHVHCTFCRTEKAIRPPTLSTPIFAAPRGMLAGRIPATESAILSPARAMPAKHIVSYCRHGGRHAAASARHL